MLRQNVSELEKGNPTRTEPTRNNGYASITLRALAFLAAVGPGFSNIVLSDQLSELSKFANIKLKDGIGKIPDLFVSGASQSPLGVSFPEYKKLRECLDLTPFRARYRTLDCNSLMGKADSAILSSGDLLKLNLIISLVITFIGIALLIRSLYTPKISNHSIFTPNDAHTTDSNPSSSVNRRRINRSGF